MGGRDIRIGSKILKEIKSRTTQTNPIPMVSETFTFTPTRC